MTSEVTSERSAVDGRAVQHVLVTGGSGFIGRSVLAALRARDVAVTVLDKDPLPAPWNEDPGVEPVLGDLTAPGTVERALRRPTSAIVHLAAVTSVLGSVRQPAETYRVNVEGTQLLLEAARRQGVDSFVLASTNAVTGNVGERTITVDLPLSPLTPYGATKAAAEMLALGYAGSYGLATSVLRLTNVYGPGMGAKDSFVPRLMRAALGGDPVRIYGSGRQSRDLVHVQDVARAVLMAIDARFTGRAIIGSGRSISVLELLDRVRLVTGRPLPAVHVDPPAGEMPAVRVDLGADRAGLGYRPSIELTEGLAGVWQDFRGLQDERQDRAEAQPPAVEVTALSAGG